MRLRRVTLAVFVLLLAGIPLRAFSQVHISGDSVCLQKIARKISLNTKITVVSQDGGKAEGRLVSVDLAQSHLTFQPSEQTLSLYRISRVEKVQYQKIGSLKGMSEGFLIGVMVGGLFGLFVWSGAGDEGFLSLSEVSLPTFLAYGGGVGGGFGLVIGFLHPTTHTIECK
ncbi:MAG: hypothetical protein L0Z48_07180 [candidate division Zixibacteria bacterium]|nr:hypothetical protein [candidate division Zixibacteria bacterium]